MVEPPKALAVSSSPMRPEATRERLIATAERLFAEHGMSVSSRQIAEAAGQGNNSVVGYHFGTKADLALAIVRSHAPDIEQRRLELLAAMTDRTELGGWLEVVVRPITDHLEALRSPSWYARFVAQAISLPGLRPLLEHEALAAETMRAPFKAVSRLVRGLPKGVFVERSDMTRHIVVYTCAERERALHLGLPTPRASWADAADGMVDALVGLWKAPVRRLPSRLRQVRNKGGR